VACDLRKRAAGSSGVADFAKGGGNIARCELRRNKAWQLGRLLRGSQGGQRCRVLISAARVLLLGSRQCIDRLRVSSLSSSYSIHFDTRVGNHTMVLHRVFLALCTVQAVYHEFKFLHNRIKIKHI
jgi:hypothetical protein